jgi:hypothetical protein
LSPLFHGCDSRESFHVFSPNPDKPERIATKAPRHKE